jgi:hypothetical protein
VGVALPFVINTPLLRDQDDRAARSRSTTWGSANASGGTFRGAGLFRSLDNIDYDIIASRDSDVEWGSVMGIAAAAAMGPFALDWKTKITITPAVDWFELESITDDDLWAGANACLLGDEVVQFRDAVQNANGTWTIWNLLRGRRGTEYACDRHVAGERFIFLSNATIATAGDLTTANGLPRYFKAVAAGRPSRKRRSRRSATTRAI